MINRLSTTKRDAGMPKRSGFTLVELLVVVTLIGVLAGLTVLMLPGYRQRERVASGGASLQNWLTIAKQRALLDRAPRGVRLLRDRVEPDKIFQAQFLEQPEDFSGGTLVSDPTNPAKLIANGVDFTGGFSDTKNWPVQQFDFLQVNDSGPMYSIIGLTVNASNSELTLSSPLPYPLTIPTSRYRIIRQPRLLGAEPETMPSDVAIDLKVSQVPIAPGQPLDIMFSPQGEVMGNFGTDRLIFFVRDISETDPALGDPTLIVLYTRTGLVESFPVNPDNYYSEIK